jgi:hypothetical protein
MSEAPPDFKALARRYLDLWQEQVAAMANDPALADVVAQGIAMMTQVPATILQAAAAGASSPTQARAADAGPSSASQSEPCQPDSAGAAPVAAAPDGARLDPDGLARRLAAAEERIAALEARLGAGGGKPAAKPGRRRPQRVD